MAFNIIAASNIAISALNETLAIAPEIAGTSDHVDQAVIAVDGAATVASQVITDPEQQKEAVLAYTGASLFLKIFKAFHFGKKK